MTDMNVTRKVTLLGVAMAQCGEAYRSDMILYVDCATGTYGAGQKEVRKWENRGLLNNRYIYKKNNNGDEAYQAIVLTHPAKLFLANNEICGDSDRTMQSIDATTSDFNLSDMTKIKIALLDVRAKLMFEGAGIPAFPYNKPTLKQLYEKLSGKTTGTPENNIGKVREENLYKKINSEEAREMLEQGIYYSIAEVRQFLSCFEGFDYDITVRSRTRGIYISNKNCFFVFLPHRGENKNIKISSRAEENLEKMFEKMLDLTRVNRRMRELERKNTITGESDIQLNGIDAIVIGDTDDIVFKLGRGLNGVNEKGKRIENKMWLTNNNLFKRVYAVSASVTGVQSISYLCNSTKEEWHEEAKERMEESEAIAVYDNNPYFPGAEKNGHVVGYMPVYEMNTLYQIKTERQQYGLMVYEDMAKPINKFLEKEINYYDIESGELINKTEAMTITSKKGTPLGRELITSELKKRKLEYKLQDVEKVYKEFGYPNKETFYNAIVKREEGAPTVIAVIEKLGLETKKGRRKKPKTVTLTIDAEFKEELKKAAKSYNLSIAKYVTKLIKRQVTIDAQHYNELLAEDRKIRKGVVDK